MYHSAGKIVIVGQRKVGVNASQSNDNYVSWAGAFSALDRHARFDYAGWECFETGL